MEEEQIQTRPHFVSADVPSVHDEVSIRIKEIFAKNQLDDLNRFIAKRSTLN